MKTNYPELRPPLLGGTTHTGKYRIFTDFTTLTGFNRKYPIDSLNREGKTSILHLNGKLLNAHLPYKTRTKQVDKNRYG
jgi:hypothetical protein